MDSFFNPVQKKYQVLSTKYKVPSTKIFQKYHLGPNTNPYLVPGTTHGTSYLVQKKATYS
jgi:hypothetical protein